VSLRNWTAAAAALYAALAVLVATGALNGIDQWAIDHLMLHVGGGDAPSLFESAVPLLHSGWSSWVSALTNVVTLPGQSVISLLILLAVRDPRWLLAWVMGTGIELLSKAVIVRPPLYGPEGHIAGFDSSFPSGHTIRILFVAAALATVWPRARPLLAAWAITALAFLELGGHHVPSDIAGGIVLAAFVVGALALLASARGARALGARGLPRRARRA
jgi:membrane-associated phospholipid phosphatase